MKIDFFNTESGMDVRAVGGGVYQVDLSNTATGKSICLYIGESACIASRCGTHLYSLFEEPGYFGLRQKDMENDEFLLRFRVVEKIADKKSVLGVGTYKELELKAIQEYAPLTQLKTSDRQIRDIAQKVAKVQNALSALY